MDARVMVVDDNEENRYLVRYALRAEGIAVIEAGDGPQCLAHLKNGFRGLIFLDVMMPGMDGWQTVKAIADAGLMEGNLICMLTSLDAPPPASSDLAAHVLDYMTKPFDQEKFVALAKNRLTMLSDAHGKPL